MNKIAGLITLFVMIVSVTGCASLVISKPSSGQSNGSQQISDTDARITNQVNSAFVGDGSVPAFDIKVISRNGTVTLTGYVGSEKIKQRANELALSVDGVRTVRNYIRLK